MIYLDNAATKVVYPQVLEKYLHLSKHFYASATAINKLGLEAGRILKTAREDTAKLLNVNANTIIFTSGASEANNMILKGFLQSNRRHLITTKVEHPSVAMTVAQLEKFHNYQVSYLDVNNEGKIILQQLADSLTKNTVLVSIILVNNETGSINDLRQIRKIIDEYNKREHTKVLLHCDITQAIGKIPIDFALLDAASFSFHKIGGLKGSGVLYLKNINLLPLIAGGGQESNYRAGTVDYNKIAANALALQLALKEFTEEHETLLKVDNYLRATLTEMPSVMLNSPADGAKGIINFSVKDKKSQVLLNALSSNGFMLSAMASCSSTNAISNTILQITKDHKRAGEMLRISFDSHLSMADAKSFIVALEEVIKEII